MENRSHALLAGVFVVLLLAAAAAAAVWLGRKDVKYETYELISHLPVAGLSIQSQVRYQGLAVGQVQGLSIDQSQPGVIVIRVGVYPDTPITKGTWGEIATQGVTGISNIDLRDDGADPERVSTNDQDPYEIPVKPGFFQKLQKSGVGMLEDAEAVLDDMRAFVDPQNAKRLASILDRADRLSDNLNQSVVALKPVIEALPATVTQLERTLAEFNKFGANVTALTQSAQQTMDYLNSPAGPLRLATKSLEQLQRSASQLQSSTLPEVNRMISDISSASRAFTGATRTFERTPQAVLFGPAPVKPGPGEPGFSGFAVESTP